MSNDVALIGILGIIVFVVGLGIILVGRVT